MTEHQHHQSQRSNIPIPDPSVLTTAALEREIGRLEQLFQERLQLLTNDLERFQLAHEQRHVDFVETSITHLQELLGGKVDDLQRDFDRFKDSHHDRHTDAVDTAIAHLSALTSEKFSGVHDKLSGVQRQFDERDERTRLAFEAAEKAVAAALLERGKALRAALEASEKAGSKSETAVSKQIEGLQAQFGTSIAAVTSQISDIKIRLAGGEGGDMGRLESRGRFTQTGGLVIAAAGILIALVSLVASFIIRAG